MRSIAAFIFVACVTASGCSSYGSEYDAVAYYLRGGSAARSSVIQTCIERRVSEKSRKEAAAALKVSEDRVGVVACNRIISGIASGRITREDYIALYGEQKITPNMENVLLAR